MSAQGPTSGAPGRAPSGAPGAGGRGWTARIPVDPLIALAIAAAFTTLLVETVADLGYARDEGFYFVASSRYAAWFRDLAANFRAAIAPRAVDAAWSVNHEHPGLIKSLFALSNLVLQKKLGLFAMEGTSFRFPAMVLSGLGVGLVYLWGTQARDRVAGAGAAALFAMMPRYFFQAHLACFDAPVVTVWAFAAYCWWRSMRDGGALWPVLTGVAFGLALDTKHNSWFLPIVCVTHAAAVQVRGLVAGEQGRAAARAGARRSLAALAAMAAIGPLVFYALWPWIWRDTFARLREYASFHLNHEYYNMEFLGRTYWTPPMPRAYAFVMTAATVPAVTLALSFAGLGAAGWERLRWPLSRIAQRALTSGAAWAARARRWAASVPAPAEDPGSTALLWFLSIGAIYGAWLSPKTPIFGGTKHWMTAYPFIALFAGAALSSLVRVARVELAALGRRVGGRSPASRLARGPVPALALGAAVIAAPVAETIHAHPWGLSAYTPLVGGAPGAATLGLNRTFWGYTTGAIAGYLNEAVPQRGSVYVHDTAGPSWDMLLRDGRLRKDIRGVWSTVGADFTLYHHEQHMLGQAYQTWVAYGTTRPDHVAGLDGVPVIWVYRAPGRRR
ncbi:MAG: glycosyltransferase family 39 protein [Polyangiaceae bacterium]|nr:glycosyltransferase family 39 protein [Polyangiaceae bacterium]